MGGEKCVSSICIKSVAPRDPSSVAEALRTRANALDRYVRRVEDLWSNYSLPEADLKYAYTGAFVSFYTEAETRLEELFLGLLMGRIAPSRASIRPLVAIQSDVVARKVLLGDRRFVDWLPYDRTQRRAEAFFAGGRPFTTLEKRHRTSLKRSSIMRNAIAHRSGAAKKGFHTEFVDGKSLPPNERQPPGYLRGQHAPGQRRINLLFAEVVAAFDALCS